MLLSILWVTSERGEVVAVIACDDVVIGGDVAEEVGVADVETVVVGDEFASSAVGVGDVVSVIVSTSIHSGQQVSFKQASLT